MRAWKQNDESITLCGRLTFPHMHLIIRLSWAKKWNCFIFCFLLQLQLLDMDTTLVTWEDTTVAISVVISVATLVFMATVITDITDLPDTTKR